MLANVSSEKNIARFVLLIIIAQIGWPLKLVAQNSQIIFLSQYCVLKCVV
jgi:hypothetical protein